VPRRIRVQSGDTLLVGEYEMDADTLAAVVNPEARVLWAATQEDDGARIQLVSYSEQQVIWLEEKDLVRSAEDS